ncbi:MAG: hypothetical protein DMG76_22540 [Acidobacteria bacterium]|nr:MAG: hypothetical protein DMG76_22540 [Acidobacteriota bacterium]
MNGNKLSARHLASMGKIQGTLCISAPINFENANPVITHVGPARPSQRLSICVLNRRVLNRTTDAFIRKRQRRLLRHGFG